jgi:hypothetical protein
LLGCNGVRGLEGAKEELDEVDEEDEEVVKPSLDVEKSSCPCFDFVMVLVAMKYNL